jgi:dTDP-4-amino-4,6-dideoxygalactose transaminase
MIIRVSKPSITALERRYLDEAMDLSDIGVGAFTGQFEASWAKYNGMSYGVACNSGTNAIYLALKAMGIGPGDEVIVPEFTMIATAWAVSYTGARPVFVDLGDDLNLDPTLAREAITGKTKAIIAVPIYGRKVSDEVYKLGIPVIEDMAEAHGIKPRGVISCYSFYGNKILTTGEGGMCLTDNWMYADEMRKLANMYFDEGRTMIHPKIGHNFRMTNIQAAIGLAQVERVDELLEKRQQIADWYDKLIPFKYLMPKRDVVWVYDIDCDRRQEEIKSRLQAMDIETRYFFKPMSRQPMYLGEYEHLKAHEWSKRGLYLPCYPEMTYEQVTYIAKCLKSLS